MRLLLLLLVVSLSGCLGLGSGSRRCHGAASRGSSDPGDPCSSREGR
jgi:hypothetical protein